MRKLLGIVMMFIFLSLLPASVFAAEGAPEGADQTVKFTIGQKSYTIGGELIEADVAPYIKEVDGGGRTMVPVAFLTPALGTEMPIWDPDNREVLIRKGLKEIKIVIDSQELLVNGKVMPMDAAAEIKDVGNGGGRTMLPIAFIARALEVGYEWDGTTSTVSFFGYTKTFESEGTFGPDTGSQTIEGNVIVKADGVVLQNLMIKGNLIISEEVGTGDVTLNNIVVKGDTFVRGGGKDSIHINGGQYANVTIENVEGQVRIVATGVDGLQVVISEDAAGEEIILEGEFEKVLIAAQDVKITTQGETSIEEIAVGEDGNNSTINLGSDTVVDKMVLDSQAEVKGTGTVKEAEVNTDGVTFDKAPEKQTGTTIGQVQSPPPVNSGGRRSRGSNSGSNNIEVITLFDEDLEEGDIYYRYDEENEVYCHEVQFTVSEAGYYLIETSPADPQMDFSPAELSLFRDDGEYLYGDISHMEDPYTRVHTYLEPGDYYVTVLHFLWSEKLENNHLKIYSSQAQIASPTTSIDNRDDTVAITITKLIDYAGNNILANFVADENRNNYYSYLYDIANEEWLWNITPYTTAGSADLIIDSPAEIPAGQYILWIYGNYDENVWRVELTVTGRQYAMLTLFDDDLEEGDIYYRYDEENEVYCHEVQFTVSEAGYYLIETSPADPQMDFSPAELSLFRDDGEYLYGDISHMEDPYTRVHAYLEPGDYYVTVIHFLWSEKLENNHLKIYSSQAEIAPVSVSIDNSGDTAAITITELIDYAGNDVLENFVADEGRTNYYSYLYDIANEEWLWDIRPYTTAGSADLIIDSPAEIPAGQYILWIYGNYDENVWRVEVTVPEPEPDISRGMVLYLNFDDNNDGDSQVSDLSGNDNHGSIMDVDKVSFVDNGGLGKAIKFGGIDNPTQITVPNAPSLNFTDALTVSYWVKIDNTKGIDGNFNYKDKGNQKVFYKGDSFHNLIYTEMENNLLLLRSGSSDYILINDASFGSVINQWSHVTFVIAGNTVQAYLNGDKAGEVELLNIDFSDANANDLYIGRGDDCLWYPLYGTIDEFRIYNRALTSAEVELLSQFAAPEL